MNKNNITYSQIGDYFLPNLKLSNESKTPLGRYGILHKNYLRERRPILYNQLLLSEKLYPLCREIDETAENRHKHGCSEEIILSELIYY